MYFSVTVNRVIALLLLPTFGLLAIGSILVMVIDRNNPFLFFIPFFIGLFWMLGIFILAMEDKIKV